MNMAKYIQELPSIMTEYEKRFGPIPVGEIEIGPDEYYRVLKEALRTNTPLPDPYFPDRPEGALS